MDAVSGVVSSKRSKKGWVPRAAFSPLDPVQGREPVPLFQRSARRKKRPASVVGATMRVDDSSSG